MAVIAFSPFPVLPDSDVPMLACCECGENPIIAPPGTNDRTRYVCKLCCGALWRKRLREFRLRAIADSSAGRRAANRSREMLIRESGKNPSADADANHDFSTLE